MNEKVKPVAKVVRGAVRIAIWEQQGKFGNFYTMTVARNYKDNDEWKSSNSFLEKDALPLSKAFSDAYEIIRSLRSTSTTQPPLEENSI
jgi:hypothetical protein